MSRCKFCGYTSEEISGVIGVCVRCIRERGEEALKIAAINRKRWREYIGLPKELPKGGKITCKLCVNECELNPGELGYCGVIKASEKGLSSITEDFDIAYAYYYYDPHPTNCVAEPVCPEREHYGYYNLAVFFAGCNLDCFYCQNIEHKYMLYKKTIRERNKLQSLEKLLKEATNSKVTCVCYFGGDPGPHAIYSLKLSRKILEHSKENGCTKRICWETNGIENQMIMKEMASVSLESGGIVKIDWKAYTPELYEALTGINGKRAAKRIMDNIKLVKEIETERDTPLLVVSTLVVPHYIDKYEISKMAEYISSIDPETPFILLAFAPKHLMHDVPTTSKRQMEEVYKAARECGLKRVYIGNYWLLS